MENSLNLVSGAFGYTGGYITSLLLEKGVKVVTLTNSSGRENAFSGMVAAKPYDFNDAEKLAESFKGVSVFYNTYWVRFAYAGTGHKQAYENTVKLFDAAKKAGVKRIVHISVANSSAESKFSYYRYKALAEEYLKNLGVSYCILKPAALFGGSGILINNIAWMIRHLPVFGIFGKGGYYFSPVHVEDLALLAVEQGQAKENASINAVGPENFTYNELIASIGSIIGKKPFMAHVPPILGFIAGAVLGFIKRDVTLTYDEIYSLTSDMLHIRTQATCRTKLTDWLEANKETVGRKYFSEVARRKDKKRAYESI